MANIRRNNSICDNVTTKKYSTFNSSKKKLENISIDNSQTHRWISY